MLKLATITHVSACQENSRFIFNLGRAASMQHLLQIKELKEPPFYFFVFLIIKSSLTSWAILDIFKPLICNKAMFSFNRGRDLDIIQ